MKDWENLIFGLLIFIPAFMGVLSYLSYLREEEKHLKNLAEFWASIGVYSLLTLLSHKRMDNFAAVPMISWLWIFRTTRLVLEDMTGQKVIKRWHYIAIVVCSFLSFSFAGYGIPFNIFTLPFSFVLGGIAVWAVVDSLRKMSVKDITSLHIASFILFGLFFIKIMLFPLWRLNPEFVNFGITSHVLFAIGFSGTGLSTYLEILKTNHKKLMDKIIKDRSDRILEQSRYLEYGLLFSGLTHEINNPLTVIKARGLMIKRSIDQDGKKQEVIHGIDQIVNSVDKITSILMKAKDYLASNTNPIKEHVALKDLFDDILLIHGQRLKNHGISVRLYGIDDRKIYCFKTELEQVLISLISNSLDAIEYLSDKWIEVSSFDRPDSVSIQIEDSGPGIPDELLPQIMEPFFTTKEKNNASGMGLYLAREIMRKHGGELYYVPNRKHTTFVLELPKVHPQEWDMVLH